jgi:hypothetical protein
MIAYGITCYFARERVVDVMPDETLVNIMGGFVLDVLIHSKGGIQR